MTARTFAAQGGATDLTITTGRSCGWTASSDATWASLSIAGGTGSGVIHVSVASNTGFASRQATLSVASQTVVLTEEGLAPCEYTLAPSSQTIAASGGTGTIDISTQSYCSWNATAGEPWLTIQAGQSGQGSGTVTYVVAQNVGQDERVTAITVGGRTASVRQTGAVACVYVLTPASQAFDPAGGTAGITVQTPAGCAWSASSDRTWIRVTSAGVLPAAGNGTVRYDVDVNPGQDAREGRVTVANQSVLVTQAGTSECSYAVSPVELGLHWHGTGGNIQVSTQTGCPWTVGADEHWLTVTSGSGGSGSAVVSFTAPTLPANMTRRGAVKVRWPTPTAGQNVWVTQEGCRYGMLDTLSAPAGGGRHRIDVLTQPISSSCSIGCPWTAVSNSAWIHVVSGSPNAGDNPFTVEIDANSTGVARSGTVVVADRTLAVSQAR